MASSPQPRVSLTTSPIPILASHTIMTEKKNKKSPLIFVVSISLQRRNPLILRNSKSNINRITWYQIFINLNK